jgi:hypothetical protein
MPADQLFTFSGPAYCEQAGKNVVFSKAVAPDLQRMIDDARKALAEDQAKGDADAKATTMIGLQSGYRSAREQLLSWQDTFHTHYAAEGAKRDAESYASFLGGKAAAPGYSWHQLSRAIDVNTTFNGKKLGALSAQKEAWRTTWFFKWLVKNAATYGFAQNPHIDEPWHWEHSGTPMDHPEAKPERELTLIVGSEVFYNTYALKMMFFAPAVRDVLQAKAEDFDTFRVVYFTEGYLPAEIQAVKNALASKPVEYVPVNNVTELIEELNKIEGKPRIQRLNMYAHGFPKHIDFALKGTTWRAASFGMEHVALIDPNVFFPDAQIWSYACQTGSGVYIKTLGEAAVGDDFGYEYEIEVDGAFDNDAECKPGASLAQALANHLGREVHAWLLRTSYAGIWNDGGDATYRAGFVEIPHPGLDGGLGRELESWLPGDDGDKDDVALWNPAGAKNGVGGADSPGGLSRTPQTYKRP